MRILLTHTPEMRANYYGERALGELSKLGEVRLNGTERVLDAGALIEAARNCEIVVSDRQTAAPAGVFENMADAIAFLRVAVDIRNIDVEAASRAGVLVTRATPGFAASVSEMALGMMVDLARGVSRSVMEYRTGRLPEARMGRQLKGATLGIIGYGVIARHLAPVALALGMKVLIADPFQQPDNPALVHLPLETLLAESDFVVCLAIANEQTENLMNAAAFARMKQTAFFINLSRGNLVDENALAAALDARRIAGAAMDVGRAADQQPSPALAARNDVIATPHTAGLTPEAIEHQAFDTVRQVADIVAGRMPQGAVNADFASRFAGLKK